MYQNISVDRKKKIAHIWDDKRGYFKFPYADYAYVKHPSGIYTSLYGDTLKKTTYFTQEDLQKGRVFESDVSVETRVLVNHYTDDDSPSVGHREMIFDIEVESSKGFPDPARAQNKITAIAIYDRITDNYTCLILDEYGKVKNRKNQNISVESFYSEEELLQRFYQKYLEINPTILSGWNIDGFDVPYLYRRTERIMGMNIANSLSPIGEVIYNERSGTFKIAGVSQLDYLKLYRLFTYTQQSSYRLDFIGKLEVNLGKIEFEGTLNDLFDSDIEKFIEYNLHDVRIVKVLDDKLKFIELARGIAHKGHVPYEDVFFSSRYLEGAILVYLKKLGIIAPNKSPTAKFDMDGGKKFSGAYVKEPKPGRYEWVYDLDLTSMYPSIIMSLNISPEMKFGKLVGWNAEEFIRGIPKTYSLEINGKVKNRLNEKELKNLLEKDISISINGIMYKTDTKGLIPSILESWFEERVEYRKLAKKHADDKNEAQYEYFNRLQKIQKVLLNSLYGVLGLPVFRFYDLDNAEAVTTTGVELIKYSEKMTDFYYNKLLGTNDKYVIYTDTDSIYASAVPLIKKKYPTADLSNQQFMTEKIIDIASDVQNFLNESFNLFGEKFLSINTHKFNIKQELISRSAFWVAKKRYGQRIINDNGVECNKLDIKGLDIVRSNFSSAFRELMTDVLNGILDNVDKGDIDDIITDFKRKMPEYSIDDISLSTGVRGMKKFRDNKRTKFGNKKNIFTAVKKGTPIHVKSAIIYNDLLKYFDVGFSFEPIRDQDKIKWCYLKPNPFGMKTIAFKGDNDPKQILDIVEKYIDHNEIFDGSLKKKIDSFYNALGWTLIDKQNSIERFF